MKQYSYLFCMLLGMLLSVFSACSNDDEHYDFPGDASNRVYLRPNNISFKILQTPIVSKSNLDLKVPIFSNRKAVTDVRGTVEVDTSLVALYNKQHGTSYKALPVNVVKLENSTLTIPASGQASTDSVHITLDESQLGNLRDTNGYLLALKVINVEGAEASTNQNVEYVVVNVDIDDDNIYDEATEADLRGQLVSERSGWHMILGDGVRTWGGGSPDSWVDDDLVSSCYLTSSGKVNFILDLGELYTFSGIRAIISYGGNSFYNVFGEGFVIETSEDGHTWTMTGTVRQRGLFVAFYTDVTARYIRITANENTMVCSDLNIYAVK